jgi:perosamine synthetase
MSRRILQPVRAEKVGAQKLVTWGRPTLTPSARFGRVIPVCEPVLLGNERRYVDECLDTNWISSKGRFIREFETRFAAACGVRHGVACTSGTAALHLIFHALGLGPGDEVIVPTLTIASNANAVRLTGARPVFVDSEPRTWTVDPARVEAKITPRTKALTAIHLYGHPCDMAALREIARRRDLWLVEDAAEAFGAVDHGRPAGSLGDVAAFSLYANKMITTGEGGVIVTDHDELAALLRSLRDLAFDEETYFWHRYVGFNYRLTNLQAALGLAQLERADDLIARRIANADRYDAALRDLPGVTPPPRTPQVRNVFWMYAVVIGDEFGVSRDELMIELGRRGIESKTFFIPLHLQPIYFDPQDHTGYPVAEDLARRGLYLPSSGGLTADELDYVASSIREIHQQAKKK